MLRFRTVFVGILDIVKWMDYSLDTLSRSKGKAVRALVVRAGDNWPPRRSRAGKLSTGATGLAAARG